MHKEMLTFKLLFACLIFRALLSMKAMSSLKNLCNNKIFSGYVKVGGRKMKILGRYFRVM